MSISSNLWATRKDFLEQTYRAYNHRDFLHPDPLEVVLRYGEEDLGDREIVALIASSLALGRAAAIVNAAETVVQRLLSADSRQDENHPRAGTGIRETLLGLKDADLKELFHGFVYRFFRGEHLVMLLGALRRMLEEKGSLESFFIDKTAREELVGEKERPVTGELFSLLTRFYSEIRSRTDGDPGILLPDPGKGSACKRFFLFLRWMVRKDAVDPGGWSTISPGELIVPVDTHMHAKAVHLGFTRRKQADLKTALEITEAFRAICPEDPVRYDFSLTRQGIRPDLKKASSVC